MLRCGCDDERERVCVRIAYLECDEGRYSISSFFVCFLDVTDDPSHDSNHRTYESKMRMKLSRLSFSLSSFEIEVDSAGAVGCEIKERRE